ncbi:MAG: acyltransferase [Ardenticatenaceae bacterium]|nr:acyltransferase [Ardenticatenaceae bacterium]
MRKINRYWSRFWMRFASLSWLGRMATRLATWGTPPYKARVYLARMNPLGFVSPEATISHPRLERSRNTFIGDRVTIFQSRDGGPVVLAEGVHLYADITIETGEGGMVQLGAETHVQPRCMFSAYKGSIKIGRRVEIAPNCLFYPYNHGTEPGQSVRSQPLESRGDIVIEDDVWLGAGVTVLDNVRIGQGAVIGAGSIVTQDIPANAIAVGAPARVIKSREAGYPNEKDSMKSQSEAKVTTT